MDSSAPGAQPSAAAADALVSALWDAIGRCRPLARARPRLAYDALAVAAGVRCVAMIDYARAAPPDLRAALAPLAALERGGRFRGGVLVLEGCCYFADMAALEARLAASCGGGGGGGDGAAEGAGADLPLVVSFDGDAPALAGASHTHKLARKLRPLLAAVQQCLARAPVPAAAARNGGGGAAAWPVVDLGALASLPCMPTLNGWLLGYPLVYAVAGYEEAAKASRMLGAGRLHLFTLCLPCAALRVLQQRQLRQGGGGGEQHQPVDALLAFTVPEELHTAVVDAAAARMLVAVGAAVAASASSGGLPELWGGPPTLTVEAVGPGAVSL